MGRLSELDTVERIAVASIKPRAPRVTYVESFRKGTAKIKGSLLPARLPYHKDGWVVDSMEVLEAGAYDDGREFQKILVVSKEQEKATK